MVGGFVPWIFANAKTEGGSLYFILGLCNDKWFVRGPLSGRLDHDRRNEWMEE